MRKIGIVIAAAAACLGLGAPSASAGTWQPAERSGAVAAPPRLDEKTLDRYRMRPEEMITIRDYYRAHPAPAPETPPVKKKKLPPGLRKKVARGGELPPGWQKKVARGEVMDPAVYQRSRPIPPELLKSLPPQPQGTVVVTVEGKAVRLLEATLTILDAFDLL